MYMCPTCLGHHLPPELRDVQHVGLVYGAELLAPLLRHVVGHLFRVLELIVLGGLGCMA